MHLTFCKTIGDDQLVKRYALNVHGRDFVVGDIHGCFSKVKMSLERIGFNYEIDRLFCVGDLIDRGPESNQVIDFLKQPWVHSVRGNHEQVLIDIIDNADVEKLEYNAQRNGMSWFEKIKDADEVTRIREYLGSLPIVIEIETKQGLVGIVHAEVPVGMSWEMFTTSIRDRVPSVTASALWGRTRIMEPNCSKVPGVGEIICGHTVVHGIARLGNTYYVDTGYVFKILAEKPSELMAIPSILLAKELNILVSKYSKSGENNGDST
ncbi:MAG: metallophosphoesterase [Mariprofundaceae bacterium]|nr:metallophosphoesterase [Mariprofundaceae bacterium]